MDDNKALVFDPDELKALKLTPKQLAFCREYLVDFNAAAAAERAGYKGSRATLRTVGYRNLHNPAVNQAFKKFFLATDFTPREVVFRLARQARASMASFLSLDPDGFLNFDFEKALRSGDLDLIERIKFTHSVRPDGSVHRQVDLKLHSAQRALKLIGQTFNMWQGFDGPGGANPRDIQFDVDTRLRIISERTVRELKRKREMEDENGSTPGYE